MLDTKQLQARRTQLIASAKAMVDIETKTGKTMSAEKAFAFNGIIAEVDLLKAQIERAERVGNAFAETRADDSVSKAFRNYLVAGERISQEDRTILNARRVEVSAAMGVGTGAGGGFTVPTGFYGEIISAQAAFGGMLDCGATILNTPTGNNLYIPTDNDVSNRGVIVGENLTMTPGPDIVFGGVGLGAFMYSSQPVVVSLQLLQDSAIDIEKLLATLLAIRIARRVNADLTNGDSVGKPKGVMYTAPLGATCATGYATGFAYDDLINLEHALDPAYRRNAKFMFHDQTLKALKKIKDNQGRPLWLPGLTESAPPTILGYEYVINQDMPVPAANAKSIAFGAFDRFFVRRVQNPIIMRLTERYADAGQVGFLLFQRWDGRMSDVTAVKYLQNSAT